MAYTKPRLGYYDPNDDPNKFFEATPEQIAAFRKPYWDADTGQRMQNPSLPSLGYERDARTNVPQVTLSNGVTGTPQFDPDTGNFTVGVADPKSSRGGFMYTVDPDTGNILKTEEYDPNSGEGDWKDFLKFGLASAGIYGAGTALFGAGLTGGGGTGLGLSDAAIADTFGPGFEAGLTAGEGTGLKLAGDITAAAGAETGTAATIADTGFTAAELGAVPGAAQTTVGPGLLASVVSGVKDILPDKSTLKDIGTGLGILGVAGTVIGAGKVISNGGTTTTTTQTQTPLPKSQQEIDLLQIQIDALKRDKETWDALAPVRKAQIEAAQREIDYQTAHRPEMIADFFTKHENDPAAIAAAMRQYGVSVTDVSNATGRNVEDIVKLTGVQLTPAEKNAKSQQEILDIQLANLKQGTNATPEQIEQINRATGAAQTQGEIDIERFRTNTLKAINEEVALASGLNPADTPIRALGDRASAEAIRQQGNLTSTLAGANATARLNYPLAASTVSNATAQSAGGLNLAASQFQAELAQQASNNRYRLFSSPFQGPQTNMGAGSLALGLGAQRTSGGTTSATSNRGLGLNDIVNLTGGIGSVIRGTSLMFG